MQRSKGAKWKGKRWMYTYAPSRGKTCPHMNQETAKSFMDLVSASFCDLHHRLHRPFRFSILCSAGRFL